MHILLIGISCVGRTTTGKILAGKLQYPFYDLDKEIVTYFGQSIERLKARFLTPHSFRYEVGGVVLKDIIFNRNNKDSVIALSPSGLMSGYLRIIAKADCLTIAITDSPVNILNRITFYDIDSKPINKELDEEEKRYYLSEIKKDMTYFGKSYKRADMTVDIKGLSIDDAVSKIEAIIRTRLH